MIDENMQDFYRRLSRIETVHRMGGGFEAPGTLGRQVPVRRPQPRSPVLRMLAVTAVAVMLTKGAMLAQIGAEAYDARLDRLRAGDQADRVGAMLLAADPATVALADGFRRAAALLD